MEQVKTNWDSSKKCPHCKSEINAEATKCPHCQSNLLSFAKRPLGCGASLLVVVGVFFLLFIFAIFLGGSNNQPQPQISIPTNNPTTTACSGFKTSQAKTISFKQLDKDPDSFKGTLVKFTGQIVEISESNGKGYMRLAVTKTSYGWSSADIIWVGYEGHIDAVTDDVVNVYGPVYGAFTYTSQANYTITVPRISGCIIKKSTSNISSNSSLITETKKIEANAPAIGKAIENATPKSWHVVTTITTDTSKNTPPFAIQGNEWRATWNCQSESTVNTTPSVYAKSTTGYSGDKIADPSSCPSGDTTYLYDGPGNFYLEIGIYSSATMTVTIEDYY